MSKEAQDRSRQTCIHPHPDAPRSRSRIRSVALGHPRQRRPAGIYVDPRIRPNFPFRPNGRHVPEYSLEEYLNGVIAPKK